jgi:hypothetical protein
MNKQAARCGPILPSLGTDVIKVEEHGQNDPARHMLNDRPGAGACLGIGEGLADPRQRAREMIGEVEVEILAKDGAT